MSERPYPKPTIPDLKDALVALEKIEVGSAAVDAVILNALFPSAKRRGNDIHDTYPIAAGVSRVAREVSIDYAPVSRNLEAARALMLNNCVYALYTTFSGKARCEIYAAKIGVVASQKNCIAKSEPMAMCRAIITAWLNLLEMKEKWDDRPQEENGTEQAAPH